MRHAASCRLINRKLMGKIAQVITIKNLSIRESFTATKWHNTVKTMKGNIKSLVNFSECYCQGDFKGCFFCLNKGGAPSNHASPSRLKAGGLICASKLQWLPRILLTLPSKRKPPRKAFRWPHSMWRTLLRSPRRQGLRGRPAQRGSGYARPRRNGPSPGRREPGSSRGFRPRPGHPAARRDPADH